MGACVVVADGLDMPPLLPPKDCVPCGGQPAKLKVRVDDVPEVIEER